MSAQIISGKQVAAELLKKLAIKIKVQKQLKRRQPGLAVILVGKDPASEIYVSNKRTSCKEVGIVSKSYDLLATTNEAELLTLIDELNNDENIDGILVQLPLPKHINRAAILEKIAPHKDVDGFHPLNLGLLAQNKPFMRPCTPKGIMQLLEHTKVDLCGMDAVVIGASDIVGKPMALELINAKATVTICQRSTKNLPNKVKNADLLIVATGNPQLIKGSWIKPGAIVIDVGINRLPNGKLVGDVEFEPAQARASWITPVPGGVGPMTIAALLENTYLSYINAIQ